MNKKSLNLDMSTSGYTNLAGLATLYNEFFSRHDYRWWYEVHPGDIVVDVGGCIGMFTCLALDSGASKVFTVEPNPSLAKTILKNASIHIFNKKDSPVTIINKAIGTDSTYFKHIYGNKYMNSNDIGAELTEEEFNALELISFKEFIKQYDIKHIDYLKIDCEGGEFDILTAENLDFIKNNVKHIAVEFHIGAFEDGPERYNIFKDTFLSQFDKSKIKFINSEDYEKAFNIDWTKRQEGWRTSVFMIYICNF
jgi:FkbM family methyltransferase